MNRDDIIRMAQDAWVLPDTHIPNVLEFASLVAAEEREACAKVAEDMGNIDGNMNKTWRNGCFDAAFAIRARGQG